jgi:hypothetical protein
MESVHYEPAMFYSTGPRFGVGRTIRVFQIISQNIFDVENIFRVKLKRQKFLRKFFQISQNFTKQTLTQTIKSLISDQKVFLKVLS